MKDNFSGRPDNHQFVVLYKESFGADYTELHHTDTHENAIKYITGYDTMGKVNGVDAMVHISGHREGGVNKGEYIIKNRKGETV